MAREFGPQAAPSPGAPPAGHSNTKELGRLIYTDYVFPFELAAVVLLVAIAYILLADRKIWAAVQIRRGPNVVGPWGLLQSFAVVALRAENTFGLLVMASEDARRFYPEMGTLYLKRIGELVSVALMPYISEDKEAA